MTDRVGGQRVQHVYQLEALHGGVDQAEADRGPIGSQVLHAGSTVEDTASALDLPGPVRCLGNIHLQADRQDDRRSQVSEDDMPGINPASVPALCAAGSRLIACSGCTSSSPCTAAMAARQGGP